jgi:hypothetical protein
VDGVWEAADRAVRRWKKMGEERFKRRERARRRGLERTRSGQVAAAAAVDAIDGGGGGFGFSWLSAEQVLLFREEKNKYGGGEEMSGAEKRSDWNKGLFGLHLTLVNFGVTKSKATPNRW